MKAGGVGRLAVDPQVAAVDVAEHGGHQEEVVEGALQHRLLVGRAASKRTTDVACCQAVAAACASPSKSTLGVSAARFAAASSTETERDA